MERDETLQGF